MPILCVFIIPHLYTCIISSDDIGRASVCPGPGRLHVRDEPVGGEGPELCSHVGHLESDVTDGEPAATAARRVRSAARQHLLPISPERPNKRAACLAVCDVEGELHAAACYPSSCTSDMLLTYKPPDLQYSMEQAGV